MAESPSPGGRRPMSAWRAALNRIFPEQFDNRYRGARFGLWLFYPITLLTMVIDLVAIFTRDGGAQSADGIPLDSFAPGAAAAVIGTVAFLGLSGLLLDLLRLLVSVRYRSMIPLMYVVLVAGGLGHKAIGLMKPIVRDGTAHGGYVSLGLIALSIIGLVLSLTGKAGLPGRDTASA